MGRIVTALDVERIPSGSDGLVLEHGDRISPHALDVARARGFAVRWTAASSPGTNDEVAAPGVDANDDQVGVAVTEQIRRAVRTELANGDPDTDAVVARVIRALAATELPGRTVTERLAEFVVTTAERGIPPPVLRETKRAVLNVLGASLAAFDHELARILEAWVGTEGVVCGRDSGCRTASILWRGTRTLSEQAAFVNAAQMHVLDFDDTHIPTYTHPTAQVLAAALAEGQTSGASGERVLVATALGMEVQLAVARMVFPSHYMSGWHITSTLGGIGAAAAAAAIHGLDRSRIANALGIAALASGGLLEAVGTMSNAFDVGHSARTGAVAAQLAAFGMDSAPTAIEGDKGVLLTMSSEDGDNIDSILDGLGTWWEMAVANSYKRFPTETITQAPLECALSVLDRCGSSAIQSMTFRVEPIVAEVCRTRPLRWGGVPQTSIQAKFDLRHCVAAALLAGRFGHEQLAESVFRDPAVVDLRSRIEIVADPAVSMQGAILDVLFADGTAEHETVDAFTGSVANPMSDEQLADKLRDAAHGRLSPSQLDAIVASVWDMDKEADVGRFVSRLAVP